MARKPWKYDPMEGLVTVKIPPSVERVGGFDDDALLAEYEGHPRWEGKSLVCWPATLVELVTTVTHLAGDQVAEDLSVAGALRWGRRMEQELVKAGWAEYKWPMYVPTAAARAAGPTGEVRPK